MNDPGRDPVHELLCKIVFGEATDEERAEAEALLSESEERRAQLAEIEATVAGMRDIIVQMAAFLEALNVTQPRDGQQVASESNQTKIDDLIPPTL